MLVKLPDLRPNSHTDASGSSKCSKGLRVRVCAEIRREAGIWRSGERGGGICTNQMGAIGWDGASPSTHTVRRADEKLVDRRSPWQRQSPKACYRNPVNYGEGEIALSLSCGRSPSIHLSIHPWKKTQKVNEKWRNKITKKDCCQTVVIYRWIKLCVCFCVCVCSTSRPKAEESNLSTTKRRGVFMWTDC